MSIGSGVKTWESSCRHPRNAKQHRVGFSREAWSNPVQDDSWYFAEADSAYVAVRSVSGEAACDEESTDKRAPVFLPAPMIGPAGGCRQ